MDWQRAKVVLVMVCGILCSSALADEQEAQRNVLCLHSYHKAAWTDALNRGYESVLGDRSGVTMLYEYMDTKKAQTPEYLDLLHRLYETKFGGLKLDLVLTSDDNAFRFALDHHTDLFADAPVVFCGVNDYRPDALPGDVAFTGVVEEGDFCETLTLATRLRPTSQRVLVICDSTATSDTNLREFRSELKRMHPQLRHETTREMTINELRHALSSMRADEIVFFIAFWRDASGRKVSPGELATLFRDCPAPVFGRSEWMIGKGLLGGKCVSGFHQGEAAALLAGSILDGTPVRDVPVNTTSPNKFMFDYRELQRHGIAERDLPQGSIISGRPGRGIHLSPRRLVELAVALLLLVLLVALLFVLLLVRHRAAQQLAESARNYREIFNATDDAILIHDATTGRVLDVNRATIDMYGFRYEDLVGIVPGELSEGRPPYSSRDALEHIRRSGDAPQVFEWRARREDGTLLWVEVSLRRSDVAGKDRVIAVVRDITERKAADARETEANERLARWERMESLGVLAGGVAHDLNNIMGPLVGLPPLIEEDLAAAAEGDAEALERVRSDLAAIEGGAQRAATAIGDLMTISRRSDSKKEPIGVPALLQSFVAGREADQLRERQPGVELVLDVADELPTVLGTASHIHRIVGNLVRNSFDALGDHGGRVSVSARHVVLEEARAGHELIPAGTYIVLAVGDTGPGIPRELVGRVFEPFFTKKVQTVVSGSGLGLSIVRSLVKDLGGYVDYRNESGSVFEIFVPVSGEQAVSEPRPVSVLGRGEHVLVVDDEPAQRDLACRVLERHGYRVAATPTGTQALELLQPPSDGGDGIDVVLLDAVMPADISGVETLRRIRSKQPDMPVVMVSGYAAEGDMSAARELGADWLAKPYSPEQLARYVRQALDVRS